MVQRKKVKSTNLKTNTNASYIHGSAALISYDPSDPKATSLALAKAASVDSYEGAAFTASATRDRFKDIDTNISVRNEFRRSDYDYFRPGEALPRKQQETIAAAIGAYKHINIVRNVIDLMADFGAQGIRLVHPIQRTQRFYRRWFNHNVKGHLITERFLNYLYRTGNVVVKRRTGKVRAKEVQKLAQAAVPLRPDDEERQQPLKTLKKNIPSGYNFLNPLNLEIAGGELAQFVGEQVIALKLPAALRLKIMAPKNAMEMELVAKLPADIKEAAKRGDPILPLDQDKLCVYYYKRDDWETWASPMIEAILDDLILYEKMKLADLAALDGAISQIRIWRLGDLEKGVLPTDAAITKLADILMSNPGGGAFDLIWGPDLQYEDASTEVHKFLGNEKYEPVLNGIYAGLGVPPTLTGIAAQTGSMTNNFISLQTLIKRLEYGRSIVRCFWERECELVRQAMGFPRAATVEFDRMVLTDEAAEKALLIQMYDRNLISEEALLDRFGEAPELEELRKRRETKEREQGIRLPQTGPYTTSEAEHELKKVALQKGTTTLEALGVDVEKTDEKTPFDKQMEMMEKRNTMGGPSSTSKSSPRGKAGQGRPAGSKDKAGTQRDRKPKVRTSAEFLTTMNWAKNAQHQISELVLPAVLQHYGKKSARSLSSAEAAEVENFRFGILAQLEPHSNVNAGVIQIVLDNPIALPPDYKIAYHELLQHMHEKVGRDLTFEEIRSIQTMVYSMCTDGED